MRSSKKILILFLAILTLALAGISGYVAYRISQENAPDEGSADEAGCGNGVAIGGTACKNQGDAVQYRCQPGSTISSPIWQEEACSSGQTCQGTACSGGTGDDDTGACHTRGDPNNPADDNCEPVTDWGGHDAAGEARAAALANPGTAYMAACNSNGNFYLESSPNSACGCPSLTMPASGCSSGTCSVCGNPIVICAPGGDTPLSCGATGCTGKTCGSGMVCQNDKCVNPNCPTDSDCTCDTGTNPTLYFCNAPTTCSATTAYATAAQCQAAKGKPCYTTNSSCLATAATYCPAQNPTLYYCRNSNSCVATTDYANGQECREDPQLGKQCYLTESQCEEPANLARWCPPENPRLYYCRTSLACSSTIDYATATECRTAKGVPCYTSNDSCLGTATTYCPVYCGDGLCNATGEKCETTTRNNAIERVCTAADTAAGRAPTGDLVDCRGVEYNIPTTIGGWRCKYCGDGLVQRGEQCDYAATPSTCNTDCTFIAAQCLTLTASATTVSDGSPVTFVLRYQHHSTTDPFPNIRLRVGDPAVGRDRDATTQSLVHATHSYNATNSVHIYRFYWEAIAAGGTTPVPDGTYPVVVLSDGSTTVIDTVACQASLTVSADEPDAPLFVINKESASVCDSNGDEVITYTITVTNIGPVQGIIDFVEDTFDENLLAQGITPTEIDPTYGAVVEGTNTIRWEGTEEQRTFTAGQSKTYSYQIRIPMDQLVEFADVGVLNEAEVQYDTPNSTDNTASFDLRTDLTCSVPVIPDTGIANDLGLFMIVGLLLIFGGVITYRYRLSQDFTENIFLKGLDRIGGYIPQSSFERNIEEKLEKKANGGKKRRRK